MKAATSPRIQQSETLERDFLDGLRKSNARVGLFLLSGIRLEGHIEAADESVIYLKDAATIMVYKHAIGSIVPQPSRRGVDGFGSREG